MRRRLAFITMKKTPFLKLSAILICSGFLTFASCGPGADEVLALQMAEDASREKDSIENELVETMDEINRNLDLIKQKQGLISLNSNPEDLSAKNEILRNISIINDLIDDNRKKIEELTIQARKLGKEKTALARIADQTRKRMQRQEQEIDTLKLLLEQESFKVADLNRRLDEMRSDNEALQAESELLLKGNAELDKNLNMAYFTYGTSDQLAEKGIIEKKGGIFGIGGKDALASAYYKNKAIFSELDIRTTKKIPVQGTKPKLLTTHPESSYQWSTNTETGYSQLTILSVADFWSTSKFLVIEVKK